MTFDSILTFVGILLAVFALIPKSLRLYLLLKFRISDYIFLLIVLILIHYLLFFEFFKLYGLTPGLKLHEIGLNPHNITYLVIFFTTVYYIFSLPYRRLSIFKIKRFADLIKNHLQEKKYADLIELLRDNIQYLDRVANSKTKYLSLIDRANRDPNYGVVIDIILNKPKNNSFRFKLFQYFLRLFRFFPAFNTSRQEAHQIIFSLYNNEAFIEYVILSHQYFFLDLLSIEGINKEDFIYILFQGLLKNDSSVLFLETRNSQNLEGRCNYWISESNKLMHFLLNDPKTAADLNISYPVGQYVIERLRNLHRIPSEDYYNFDTGEFHEKSEWKSDIFVAIHLFNLMVSRAIYKNNSWHMWLDYYYRFIKEMIRNHDDNDPFYDENSEWPTIYEYLIYTMFSNMCDWLLSLEDQEVDVNRKNLRFDDSASISFNSNILTICIRVIGQSLKAVIDSVTIGERFKIYIFGIVLDLYFDLRNKDELRPYALLLAKAIFLRLEYRVIVDEDPYYELIEDYFNNKYDLIPQRREFIIEFREFIQYKGKNIKLNDSD